MLPMIPRAAPPVILCVCVALAGLLGSVAPAAAQPVASAERFVVDDNYRVSPGDVLIVTVLGEDKLTGSLTVGVGGSIALPIVGSVQVIGKSLQETRALIARTYKDVIREPYVSVALDETASKRRVYVGGAVEKPGSFLLQLGGTPAEAVVAAGLTEDSDLTRVTLLREGGEKTVIDLSGLRTHEPLTTGIYLRWDDRIYVPNRDNRLTVIGQVVKPGSYVLPLGRTVRVLDLLTQIGGGPTENADRQNAMLIRNGGTESTLIDLRRMLEQGDMSQNYELQGGDVLVVSEADRVTVAGEVLAPASFYGGNKLTLLEALVKAGGFTPLAGLKQAKIKKADGQITPVDLDALWRRGDLTQNVALTAGDVVIVPRADPEEVLVTGAIAKPGTMDVRDEKNRSLLKLLVNAGTMPASDLSRVSIYRVGGELLVANVRAAMEQGDMRGNPQLQGGDVVWVPDSGKVALMGAFSRSGLLDYDPKLTLMQYIASGGLAPPSGAVLARGVLIRARPDGTYETVTLDLSRLKDGIVPEPVKVKPGDIIYFEPKGEKKNLLDQIRDAIWTIGGLRGLGLF